MKKSDRPALAIRLLGGFDVRIWGKSVADVRWSRRQAKQLVKLLALIPKHQLHRQQLIDAICPDLDADAGAANLHKIIHLARHALEPALKTGSRSQFIMTHEQQVQLRAPGQLWIDVEEFERAGAGAMRSGTASDYEQALELYGGDLLAEDRYADWCAQKRDQLRAVREQLLMRLGRESSRLLFGLVMYILQDRASAEDTLVDVYLKVQHHAVVPRPEQNPVAWLIGLARQAALARLVGHRQSGRTVRRPPLPGASVASVLPFEPLDSERRQVGRALTQLSPRERSIIQMTYFEGLSAREVAHQLSVPTTQVTSDIQQAMWKLRTSLTEMQED